jgi:hypothetical protein
MSHSFELPPLAERIQQYREMADATLLKAQQSENPDLRAHYCNLATRWHALAQQLEEGADDSDMPSYSENTPANSQPD